MTPEPEPDAFKSFFNTVFGVPTKQLESIPSTFPEVLEALQRWRDAVALRDATEEKLKEARLACNELESIAGKVIRKHHGLVPGEDYSELFLTEDGTRLCVRAKYINEFKSEISGWVSEEDHEQR